MDQVQWNVISAVFDAAIELPPDQREAFVHSASKGTPSVVAEVLAMLAADCELANNPEEGDFLRPLDFPDDALEPFQSSPPPFQPGQLVRERFRIIRQVGEGGMGHVFEAWDEELGIRVALKAIRPELSNHAESLTRFRREVRVGLQANHPNICRTFQIDHEVRPAEQINGVTERIYFFTMEFLDGETLATRVARADSALTFEESLAIARQIAAALDCAHDLGVVHRDIKPANVMLVPVGATCRGADTALPAPIRAVVTDFGLAHLDPMLSGDQSSSISRSGFAAGTLAYMAPEQINGESVSAATDVYAFGLVLFEMVTGQRAFRPGVARPTARTLVPDLPPQRDQTIERCLDPDPQKRFARASEAVKALTEPQAPVTPRPVLKHNSNQPSWIIKLVTAFRRPVFVVGTIVVVMALFAVALRLYLQGKANPAVDPGTLVYLAPVRNETGEKPMENLTELIQAGLTQSAHINLVDQGRAGDILQEMTKPPETAIDPPIAREIALRTGGVRVILPTVAKSGKTYTLRMEIQQPDTNSPKSYRHAWINSWTWQAPTSAQPQTEIPAELLNQVRDATDWTRSKVGESANDIARLNAPPEDVTTSSWEALRYYSDAQSLISKQRSNEAVSALRSAIREDPKFALAEALLGDILVNLGHDEQGYSAYRMALSQGDKERLSLRERERIKGIIAHDTEDYEQAEIAYREYVLYYPHDYFAWFRRGRPLLMLGRTQDSIAVLEQAHKVDPGKSPAVVQLVRANLILGDTGQARRWLDELQKNHSRDYFLFAKGPAQFVEGDYLDAEKSLQELSRSADPSFQWNGDSLLADLRAEQGRYREAMDIISQRLAKSADNPMLLLDRAQLYCRLKDFVRCDEDLAKATALDPSPGRAISASTIVGRAIESFPGSQTDALRRRLGVIEKNLDEGQEGLVYQLATYRVRGERLLADGSYKAAVSAFRKASTLDAPANSREYLSRALVAEARQTPSREARQSMLYEARSLYAAVAFHPAVIWQFAQAWPPGFFSDQAEAWLRVDGSCSVHDRRRASLEETLARLRPQSPVLADIAAGIGFSAGAFPRLAASPQ